MFSTRWLHVFLTILVVSAMLGTTTVTAQDATPTEAKKFARTFDIGGRSLFLNCQGRGSPTVILEHAGYYGGAGDYTRVLGRIAEITRVCVYDRANTLGGSDAAPTPRTGADVVADLHALLEAADVPGLTSWWGCPSAVSSTSLCRNLPGRGRWYGAVGDAAGGL